MKRKVAIVNLKAPSVISVFAILLWSVLFLSSAIVYSEEKAPQVKDPSEKPPNILESVGYSPLKNGRVLVKINFSRPIGLDPEVEETADPPQVSLIFDNAVYEPGENTYHVNIGVLRGIKIVKTDDGKAKVSFYLNSAGSYDIRVQNDQLMAVLRRAASPSTPKTSKRRKEIAAREKKQEASKIWKTRQKRKVEKDKAAPTKVPAENIEWGEISGQTLVMFKGDIRIFYGGQVSQIAVGDSAVISASVLDTGELLMIGEAAGNTVVHIWHEDGSERDMEIYVNEKNSENIHQLVTEMLSNVVGVSVRKVGNLVVVDGVLTKSSKERVDIVAKLYPKLVNLTTIGKVTKEKMIYMNLQIVEFNKRALETLGIKWSEQISGPQGALAGDVFTNNLFRPSPNPAFLGATVLPPRIDPFRAYLGIATSIQSKINLSVRDGNAFILASPRLSARSGGEATFLAGGEIPLPVVDQYGQQSVTFKEYGVKMTINPTADDSGYILSKISTEISDVDSTVTVAGIPGFITRKTEAEINVNDGDTMVIGGLMNTQMGKNYAKFPFLGDIPIIGWLFKSKDFNDKRTELVIFVTSNIVDPESQIIKEELEKARRIKEDFNNRVEKGIVY